MRLQLTSQRLVGKSGRSFARASDEPVAFCRDFDVFEASEHHRVPFLALETTARLPRSDARHSGLTAPRCLFGLAAVNGCEALSRALYSSSRAADRPPTLG